MRRGVRRAGFGGALSVSRGRRASMGRRPGAISSWIFWGSLAFALAIAFVVTLPINRWMIGRGRGHAVVHAYHH